MLDPHLLRDDPDRIRRDLGRRGLPADGVDAAVEADASWRKSRSELDRLRQERNRCSIEIGTRKKAGTDAADLLARMKEVGAAIEAAEGQAALHQTVRDRLLWGFPNLMHETVPEGADESDNQVVREHGEAKPHDFEAVSHVDLLTRLGIADIERAARVSGARFYYLTGDGVRLSMAIQQYALEELAKKGFRPVDPPYVLRRDAVAGAVDLADFRDVIYKVEDEDLYLIATSEHPLAAMHADEIIEEKALPLKYAGVSPCFRKEAGAHGRDTKGIFRVRQFHKVEQFVFATPETSWKLHEELLTNAESLMKGLGIPYRVVNVCTGDLGGIAAKKYDIEAWMPVQGAYREVVSASNCTDYQARRYRIRTRKSTDQPTRTLHTLNATALAVERTIVAILENFQNADGSVTVPKPLRPFMAGTDHLRA